jgi:hypothetical protein
MDTRNRTCDLRCNDDGSFIQVARLQATSRRVSLVSVPVSLEQHAQALFDVSAARDVHHRNIEDNQSQRENRRHLVHLVNPSGPPQRMREHHQD